MTDTFLRIIPSDPSCAPSGVARDRALQRLREALPGAEVEVRCSEEITFVDAGSNFEAAYCPKCSAEVDEDWWGAAMGDAAESDFVRLELSMPCCGTETSLNELRYDMPQGFARCVLEAANPNAAELPAPVVAELSALLGCPVRSIWAHY